MVPSLGSCYAFSSMFDFKIMIRWLVKNSSMIFKFKRKLKTFGIKVLLILVIPWSRNSAEHKETFQLLPSKQKLLYPN